MGTAFVGEKMKSIRTLLKYHNYHAIALLTFYEHRKTRSSRFLVTPFIASLKNIFV